MVKKLLQDVLPPDKKTIRHIPLSSNERTENHKENDKPSVKAARPKNNKAGGRRSRFFKLILVFLVFVVICTAILLTSWMLSSAQVTVEPKHLKTSIDVTLESFREGQNGVLVNRLVTATSTLTETVTATIEKQIERKASGKVVIYNNFSNASQRLIKNTRLQSLDGKIYRINSSVTIPGTTTSNGKTIPGSLAVTVYAEAPGTEYNLKLSELKGDFTIPGFKNSPRYNSFYGRQQTDISGGFSGLEKVVEDSVLEKTENSLRESLRNNLFKSASENLPPNLILFPDAFFIEYGDMTLAGRDGDNLSYEMTAVSHSILFDRGELARAIAKKALKDYDNAPILLEDYNSLKFLPKSPDKEGKWQNEPFVFSVAGEQNFVWQFDADKLSNELAAKQKNYTETVMAQNFPSINRAEIVIKPFWIKNFPKNPSKIKVKVQLD